MKHVTLMIATAAICISTTALSRPFFDPRSERGDAVDSDAHLRCGAARRGVFCTEAGVDWRCRARQCTYAGGSRWTGFSNFELAYGGKIVLLDAFFDRGSNYVPLGFKAAEVGKADAILIGHAHFDHMSDAGSVGLRTGATIVGAPVTTEKLAAEGVPAAQIRTVSGRGEELLKFDGFSVQPILARHGQPDKHITEVMEGALNSVAPKETPNRLQRRKKSWRAARSTRASAHQRRHDCLFDPVRRWLFDYLSR